MDQPFPLQPKEKPPTFLLITCNIEGKDGPCGFHKKYRILPKTIKVGNASVEDIQKLAGSALAECFTNFFSSHTEVKHPNEASAVRESIAKINNYVTLRYIKSLVTFSSE